MLFDEMKKVSFAQNIVEEVTIFYVLSVIVSKNLAVSAVKIIQLNNILNTISKYFYVFTFSQRNKKQNFGFMNFKCFCKYTTSRSLCPKGPFMYYARKIVGWWVSANACNCLYTGWVWTNSYIRFLYMKRTKKQPNFLPIYQNCLIKQVDY